PEVVKLETEARLRSTLNEHIEEIQKRHRQLLAVFGQLNEVVLPNPDEVEAVIGRVFSSLGVSMEEIPFTLESAKASLVRTVKKITPRDKSLQYKDGVLWEDCLMLLLEKEAIFLVSNDNDFYKVYSLDQGLAAELKRDIEGKPNECEIFPKLADLL